MPLRKINVYRERWGLPPLTESEVTPYVPPVTPPNSKPQQASGPVAKRGSKPQRANGPTAKKKGCSGCGGKAKTAKPNGWGPGSQLLKDFESSGVPHCEACIDLAGKMDRWGKKGCTKHIDKIVADILPRAREWMSEKHPCLHRLFPAAKLEDVALKVAIRLKVNKAIDNANKPKRTRPKRKKRPGRGTIKPPLRPDDKSNLISSTAIGQPAYTLGTHKTVERVPFTAEPTRNLIYHVWPSACDDIWRWNLDLLLEYIDLFNGRRIVAIAVDHETDAEAVQDHLAGEVLEFMIFRNNPKAAEMVSFLPLLAQVESHDVNTVTFRAHAKGVHRICKEKKPHLRDWVEMLYRTNLGDWPTVRDHLESAAMTGACRKMNMFTKAKRIPAYSGSFYWFRNCFVFSRESYLVDGKRWGCESWPGKHFSEDETRCLFLDETGSMYSANYWRDTVKPAYNDWLAERGMAV